MTPRSLREETEEEKLHLPYAAIGARSTFFFAFAWDDVCWSYVS